jgi:hypothetical protein
MLWRNLPLRIAILATPVAAAAVLPEQLGPFKRTTVNSVPLPPGDRELLEEYRLREATGATYVHIDGRQKMVVQGYRFADSLAGEAVGWRNYAFRFRHSAPEGSDLRLMLGQLSDVAPASPEPLQRGQYWVESSERIILGPVSLAKFLPRIRPSVAAFRLGASARTSRHETPAGPVAAAVFVYPTAEVARGRLEAFQASPGAVVSAEGHRVRLHFGPADDETIRLVGDHYSAAVTFDLASLWCNPWCGGYDLGDGLTMIATGYFVGALFALLGALIRRNDGFADHTTLLRLSS